MSIGSIGLALTLVACSVVYAFVGAVSGIASGFIAMKLVEIVLGVDVVFSAIGQLAVAGWALLLACGAVFVYLRSPLGDLRSSRRN